jgi:hypothetical protein
LRAVCLTGMLLAFGLSCQRAGAEIGHVDGISDQSLPAWDGSFDGGPFTSIFRSLWIGGPRAGGDRIAFARYVLQWNAIAQASKGADADGDYRERFEAWLEDVRGMGLVPVLALTSYDGVHPDSRAAYRLRLEQVLERAAALHDRIAYVEPWNEPNGQGHEPAVKAAELADTANSVCELGGGCQVVAGDFEDASTLASYERAYVGALTFPARLWGAHPYVSVSSHSDASLRQLKANLPRHGAGDQLWLTEIGALLCRHGQVRGEARQAIDASYLLNTLIPDPAIAPAHVFYYGFLYGHRTKAPCAAGGGDDSELYAPNDQPRAAASVVLGPASLGSPFPPVPTATAIASSRPLTELFPASLVLP